MRWLPALLLPLFAFLTREVSGLGVRTQATNIMNISTARLSASHPIKVTEPVTMWCAPDNPQVTINRANFKQIKTNKLFPATLSQNKKNATYTVSQIDDAGEYSCELETGYGKIMQRVNVYIRPVVDMGQEHFTAAENDEFKLTAPAVYATEGDYLNLTCNVQSYPKPVVKWTKDGKPLEISADVVLDGSVLRLKNATREDAGTYSCESVNEYSHGGKTTRTLLVLQRDVLVKSGNGWIWPTLLIIIILVVLVAVILFCEFRKKHTSKSSRYVVQE